MSQRLLVIDCATPALSIALFDGDRCRAAQHDELGRGHAEALLPALAALPDGGRAEAILVDVGPGSFTGVRVGVAAAMALGFAWGVPVHGFRCLDLVAAQVRADHAPTTPFPVVMIGGHGELFWGLYPPTAGEDGDGDVELRSTPIAELADMLADDIVYGSGARTLVAARDGRGDAVPMLPDARCTLLLAPADRSHAPRPNYGRGADAKPMATRAALSLPVQSLR